MASIDLGKAAASCAVYDAGGRMVILRPDTKVPAWKGFLRCRRPTPGTLVTSLERGFGLGAVPGSFTPRLLAVDVDQGDAANLWRLVGEPGAKLHNGAHGLFDGRPGLTKRPFSGLAGCAGDLIQDGGYIALHGDGLYRLADALLTWKAAPIQLDLFGALRATRRPEKAVTTLQEIVTPAILEAVQPGARNNSLFDVVRYYAYSTKTTWTTSHVGEFTDRVEVFALQQNERFPAPLPANEVRWTAVSVATWTWDNYQGFNPYDHTPKAQRRRAVKRWHGNGRRWTLDQVERRNQHIVRDALAGWSLRVLAGRYGFSSPASVRNVLRAEGVRWNRHTRAWE